MLQQVYSDYTPEDQKVWNILFERQIKNLEKVVADEYLEGIKHVQFTSGKIPDFKEVNALLKAQTGWSLHVVPGLIPQNEFFPLLVDKKFSASTWLRRMNQLDYIEEPDMFHDVFGHVPLLSNENFCKFFKGIAQIAVEHIDNPQVIEMIGRLYWFTIEFGLIRNNGELKIYGAGIVSSYGETKYCISDVPQHLPYDVTKVMHNPFFNDRIQDRYYVIDSFQQLYDSLGEIGAEVERVIKETVQVV